MRAALILFLVSAAGFSASATTGSLEDLANPNAQWVSELPVFSRTQKVSDDPEDPELMVSEKNPGQLSFLADSQLKSLVPQRFRLAQDEKLQALVDQITIQLFASNKVRESLCFLGAETSKDFSRYLGVSSATTKVLVRECRNHKVSSEQRRLLGIMKSQFPGEESHQRPKRFGLILSLSNRPAFEGFTTKDGITLIVLHQDELSVERLLRVWIHELAISYDRLGVMAPRYGTDWSKGLSDVLGLDRKEREQLEAGSDAKALSCALRDPAVRYALASERAFRFEDDIMQELGLLESSPALSYRSLSCAKAIGRRAVQISPLAPVLLREIRWESFYEECGGVDLLKDAERSKTLVSRIKLVAKTTIKARPDQAAEALCDVILEPHVGARTPEVARHGGPRPRIGGWE